MNTLRTISAAGVAAAALVGGAALTGSTALADRGDPAAPSPAVPQRTLVSACNAGGSIALRSRSMDFQSVAAGATAELEGSQWQFRGPRSGTDTVLVTVTAMASSGGAGELTTIAFYKDGVGTSEGTKYFTYNGVLDQATAQFCTKVGQGQHTLALRVTDGSGGATTLYYPTVVYQRFK